MQPVAHHTDIRLIANGPLATLFAGGGPPVVHQWKMQPSICRLRVVSDLSVAFCYS